MRFLLYVLIIVSAFFMISCQKYVEEVPEQNGAFYFNPYVNNAGHESVVIRWVTAEQGENGAVYLKKDEKWAVHEAQILVFSDKERKEKIHSVTLDDLEPSTMYEYTVMCDGKSVAGSFTTIPEPGSKDPIRFVVYGDTRTEPEEHRIVSKAIAAEDPLFVVNSGDFVTRGDVWEQWKVEFHDPAHEYLKKSVLWPVRGNHEQSAVYFSEMFNVPDVPDVPVVAEKTEEALKESSEEEKVKKASIEFYYSADIGNLHLIVLDTHIGRNKYAQMLEWLKKDLEKNKSAWTMLALHVPVFNIGGHGSTWGHDDVLNKESFIDVMEKGGVDIVICGHSHLYERFVPIGPKDGKPIIHIVSGGGGAPVYGIKPGPILASRKGTQRIGVKERHYCLFKIKGNRLEMEAKTADGKVFDTLVLEKNKKGLYQEEIMSQVVDTQTALTITRFLKGVQVDFPVIPKAGDEVGVKLNIEALGAGTKIQVLPSVKFPEWKIKDTTVVFKEENIFFPVLAPKTVNFDLEKGISPTFRFSLKLYIDGYDFPIIHNVAYKLGEATLTLLVPQPEIIEISRIGDSVKVDGDASEWADISPLPQLPFDKKPGSVKTAWNDTGLYGLLEMEDDDIKMNAEAPWTADSLELFIENDRKRVFSYRKNKYANQIIFSPDTENGEGNARIYYSYGNAKDNPNHGGQAVWKKTEKGYIIEFFLSRVILDPIKLEAGTVIGFDLKLNNDGKTIERFNAGPDVKSMWSRPVTWGAIQFTN